jgi:hypothetical protein
MEAARLDPKYFTRRRTLTLPTVVSFLLSSVHAAVQSELDQFFANLCNRADSVRQVSAQVFYQARYQISKIRDRPRLSGYLVSSALKTRNPWSPIFHEHEMTGHHELNVTTIS